MTTVEDSNQKAKVVDSFGENTSEYQNSKKHSKGKDLKQLESWCKDATKALDVATGAGHTAGALIERGIPIVVASDISVPIIQTSINSYPNIIGVASDAEELPFKTNTFDAVTCRIAAHHFPNPNGFLEEVSRILSPEVVLS